MGTKVITVTYNKGGVCKTTVIVTVATGLHLIGKRVLVVGLDPQADMETCFGINIERLPVFATKDGQRKQRSLNTLLTTRHIDLHDMIHHVDFSGYQDSVPFQIPRNLTLDVLPSGVGLDATDRSMDSQVINVMSAHLKKIKEEYDFVLIDTRRAESYLTLSALLASTHVLIPVAAEYLPAKNIGPTLDTIATIRRQLNPQLNVLGIIFTMVRARTRNAQAAMDEITTILTHKARTNPQEYAYFLQKILPFYIRHTVKYSEASTLHMPIQFYPNKEAREYSADYVPLIELVLKGGEHGTSKENIEV